MALRIALLAVITLMGILGATAELKALNEVVRRSLQALPSASQPCVYDATGELPPWFGSCAVNPAWLANQTGHSSGAKAVIYQARYDLACSKHAFNVPIAAIVAAISNRSATVPPSIIQSLVSCDADKANYCYMTISSDFKYMNCLSYGSAGLVKYAGLCKGAPYTEYLSCQMKRREECNGTCVWNTKVSSNPTLLNLALAATSNMVFQREFCWPASSGAANWTSVSQSSAYARSIVQDPSTRGNCTYARGAVARVAYDQRCAAANNADPLGAMQGVYNATSKVLTMNGINATLANQCLAFGCELQRMPPSRPPCTCVSSMNSDWFTCFPRYYERQAINWFDRSRDIALLRANRVCAMPELQFNPAACSTAKLTAY